MRVKTPPAARLLVAAASILACVSGPCATATAGQAIGDINVFANVPYPGNPGAVAVNGDTVWVDTSAANVDRPFDAESDVFAYELDTGRLQNGAPNPLVVPKKKVAAMGLAGMALDRNGRLYIADMNGQVLRVTPSSGAVELYGTIPTSTQTSVTSMPTFDAFGPDGSLYVGDAGGEPFIWRIPPGGGSGQLWFADPRLLGSYGGTVLGVAVDPTRQWLYFAAGNQAPQVSVFRLPLASPDTAHLRLVHAYTDIVPARCSVDPSNSADVNTPLATANCEATQVFGAAGIAFGRSGRLYVSLLAKNQLSILDPDGSEALRFPSAADNIRLPVPVNGPFGIGFDGRGSLLIANVGDATTGYGPDGTAPPGGLPSSSSWAVLSAWVDDTASPLIRPVIK